MLLPADAERIVAESLEASGHRVLRVDLFESIHSNQRPWLTIGVICLGERKVADSIDRSTLSDEEALRSFLDSHFIPEVN